MSDEYTMELCGNRAAYQVTPNGITKIDLEKVGETISAAGYDVGIQNRLCWTFSGKADLTLYPSGKLLVKTEDKTLAGLIAKTHIEEWLKSEY
ncbi:MAG: hypothetical protein ACPGAN_07750 [Candidatus Poseidoniaceae archaeon]